MLLALAFAESLHGFPSVLGFALGSLLARWSLASSQQKVSADEDTRVASPTSLMEMARQAHTKLTVMVGFLALHSTAEGFRIGATFGRSGMARGTLSTWSVAIHNLCVGSVPACFLIGKRC